MINSEKYKKLLSLHPDIAVVQECLHPDRFNNKFYIKIPFGEGKTETKVSAKDLAKTNLVKSFSLRVLCQKNRTVFIIRLVRSVCKEK